MTLSRILFVFPMLGLIAGTARGETLYTTFGPVDSFDLNQTWGVYPGQSVGAKFGLLNDSFVNEFTLALQSPDLGSTFTVSLNSANGVLPGSQLQSWNVAVPKGRGYLATIAFPAPLSLPKGNYFLVARNPSTGLGSAWHRNSIGLLGNIAFNQNSGWFATNDSQVAFRVSGSSVVPEPSLILLLGTGMLALARKRKVRQTELK